MKIDKVTEIKVVTNLGTDRQWNFCNKGPETDKQWRSRVQGEVDEVNDFLRDHRSQDNGLSLMVEVTEGEVCSFCNREWETEPNGEPMCCSKAVEEFMADQMDHAKQIVKED